MLTIISGHLDMLFLRFIVQSNLQHKDHTPNWRVAPLMGLCLLALKLVSPTLHCQVSYSWRRAMPKHLQKNCRSILGVIAWNWVKVVCVIVFKNKQWPMFTIIVRHNNHIMFPIFTGNKPKPPETQLANVICYTTSLKFIWQNIPWPIMDYVIPFLNLLLK